jgi:hypothetical protein
MDLLRIYLQDHLAACTGTLELARRAHGANRGTAFDRPLAELRDEIETDRAALTDVMARLGVGPDRLKETAAWSAEKAGRLKLNGRVRGYSPLSRVLELEALELLLHGMRRVWLTLGSLHDARLADVGAAGVVARLDDQLARVTELHARASALAFRAGATA